MSTWKWWNLIRKKNLFSKNNFKKQTEICADEALQVCEQQLIGEPDDAAARLSPRKGLKIFLSKKNLKINKEKIRIF